MTYTVATYLSAGLVYNQTGKSIEHAREMAARIVREGLWMADVPGEPAGTELFVPVDKITKVKLMPHLGETEGLARDQLAVMNHAVDLLKEIGSNVRRKVEMDAAKFDDKVNQMHESER